MYKLSRSVSNPREGVCPHLTQQLTQIFGLKPILEKNGSRRVSEDRGIFHARYQFLQNLQFFEHIMVISSLTIHTIQKINTESIICDILQFFFISDLSSFSLFPLIKNMSFHLTMRLDEVLICYNNSYFTANNILINDDCYNTGLFGPAL